MTSPAPSRPSQRAPRPADWLLSRVVNPVVRRVLASPLHDLLSGSVVAIGVRGRRSGLWREVVASYTRDRESLVMVSRPSRSWWRNLLGGSPVRVVLEGVQRTGAGRAEEIGGVVHVRIDLEPPPTARPVVRGWPLWRRWFAAATTGEVLGFFVPAVVAPFVLGARPGVAMVTLVLAGTAEGALLGAGQAYALRQAVPAVPTRSWVGATAVGAGFAWLLGMLPSTVGPQLWALSPVLTVVLGAAGAVAVIAGIGVLQWRVLRRYLPASRSWIAATGAAWIGGLLAFTAVTTPLWHEGQAVLVIALIGLIGAALMAAVVASVTGLNLMWITSRADSGALSVPTVDSTMQGPARR